MQLILITAAGVLALLSTTQPYGTGQPKDGFNLGEDSAEDKNTHYLAMVFKVWALPHGEGSYFNHLGPLACPHSDLCTSDIHTHLVYTPDQA